MAISGSTRELNFFCGNFHLIRIWNHSFKIMLYQNEVICYSWYNMKNGKFLQQWQQKSEPVEALDILLHCYQLTAQSLTCCYSVATLKLMAILQKPKTSTSVLYYTMKQTWSNSRRLFAKRSRSLRRRLLMLESKWLVSTK